MKLSSTTIPSILLLSFIFLFVVFTDAKCVPRNASRDVTSLTTEAASPSDGTKNLKNTLLTNTVPQEMAPSKGDKKDLKDILLTNTVPEKMTSFDSQEKSSDDDGDEKKKESKEDDDSESKEKSSDDEEDKKKKESKEDEERDSEEKSSDDDDDNEKKESKEDEKSESKEKSSDDDDDDKEEEEKSDKELSKEDETIESKEKSDDDDDDKKKKSKKDSSEEEDEDNDDDDKEKEKKSEDSKDEDDDKDKSSSYSTSKDPILTHKICGETRYPKDCLKSISPYFTGATDPESVLKMEVQAVRQGFVNAITKVKKMKKEAEGKWDKSALDTCVENFQDGLDDLDSALDAITEHNADELQTMLSSVLTYVTTCEDSMAEDPDGHDLPNIMNMEQKLTNLATNSLDIAEKQLNRP